MATITQRKTGWQVQVRRNGFKPLSKHFKTSADAKAWARTIEAEMDRGVFVDRSQAQQTTLADILQRYQNTVTPLKRGQKQAITGHKTLQMLKRYTHPRAEDLVRLIGYRRRRMGGKGEHCS